MVSVRRLWNANRHSRCSAGDRYQNRESMLESDPESLLPCSQAFRVVKRLEAGARNAGIVTWPGNALIRTYIDSSGIQLLETSPQRTRSLTPAGRQQGCHWSVLQSFAQLGVTAGAGRRSLTGRQLPLSLHRRNAVSEQHCRQNRTRQLCPAFAAALARTSLVDRASGALDWV